MSTDNKKDIHSPPHVFGVITWLCFYNGNLQNAQCH